MSDTIKALLLQEEAGKVSANLTTVTAEAMHAQLPDGTVTVSVSHSTLNYKDGMIIKGVGRLVRKYPHIPGIDLAGTILESNDVSLKPGDPVILTGWHVGERCWGGYAQQARLKANWLVPITSELQAAGLTPSRAMAIGTAGFTAMLAVLSLEEQGLTPTQGPVLVTGAAGGVGSVTVALLSKLGYEVAASTGRAETEPYLKKLGASRIIPRDELAQGSGKPLESENWAAAVDSVGGTTLSTILTQLYYGGIVAACGLAGGSKLETTVIPFLLRGVKLLGIDSVTQPLERRKTIWARLVRDLDMDVLDQMTHEVDLAALPNMADQIIAGQIQGRTVVNIY